MPMLVEPPVLVVGLPSFVSGTLSPLLPCMEPLPSVPILDASLVPPTLTVDDGAVDPLGPSVAGAVAAEATVLLENECWPGWV